MRLRVRHALLGSGVILAFLAWQRTWRFASALPAAQHTAPNGGLPWRSDTVETRLSEKVDNKPRTTTCSRYAGPLRWRQHPGGRDAPSQQLQLLPLPVSRLLDDGPAPSSKRRRLVPFAPASLELLPGGPFADAALTNARFLSSLPLDRLLFSFRSTAGLPQPAQSRPYGGWESPGAGIRGHFVGHWLSGAALAAAGAGAGGAGPDRGRTLATASHEAVSVLTQCAKAHSAAGRRGYLAAFPVLEFDKSDGLGCAGPGQCNVWVPHYATQKVLSGLITQHEALGTPDALPLALGMAEWVYERARASRMARGEAHWAEGLNYEVGALSEVYASLAHLTRNVTWLDAASLFDRRCFTGALAYAGTLHDPHAALPATPPGADGRLESAAGGGDGERGYRPGGFRGVERAGGRGTPQAGETDEEEAPGLHEPQSAAEQSAADAAFSGMHANAQLAYVLGAAELYLATGEARARVVTEAFWRELQRAYVYLTGGSSFQEEWRAPVGMVETSLHHRGASNWVAHDHQESCVTHNLMLLSSKMVRWHLAAARGVGDSPLALRSLFSLCDWYERALYNGVLGTQRGVQPGAMLYMMPLGGGVSKAGGAKRWSGTEHHFWCCVGSAAEAFGRLHHAVWWAAPSPDYSGGADPLPAIYLLQLVPSRVRWVDARLALRLDADVPGEVLVSDAPRDPPLLATVTAQHLDQSGHASATPPAAGAAAPIVHVRIPRWVRAAEASLLLSAGDAPTPLPLPSAGSMLAASLPAGASLTLRLWPRLELRRVSPASELHSLFYGPVLLAALTDGDRLLGVQPTSHPDSWAVPVPNAARRALRTLELACDCAVAAGSQRPHLVGYAPAEPAGRVRDGWAGLPVELMTEPAVMPMREGRRGGSDAANRVSWRIVGAGSGPHVAGGGLGAASAHQPVLLEPMDRPGMLLSARAAAEPTGNAGVRLELLPAPSGRAAGAAGAPPLQRWRLRPVVEQACSCGVGEEAVAAAPVRQSGGTGEERNVLSLGAEDGGLSSGLYALESADRPGEWVVVGPPPPAPPPSPKRERALPMPGLHMLLQRLGGPSGVPPRVAAVLRLSTARASYPPLAYWARSNVSAHPACRVRHELAHGCEENARPAFLMVPLNGLLDERYSPFLCVLGPGQQVPEWCL